MLAGTKKKQMWVRECVSMCLSIFITINYLRIIDAVFITDLWQFYQKSVAKFRNKNELHKKSGRKIIATWWNSFLKLLHIHVEMLGDGLLLSPLCCNRKNSKDFFIFRGLRDTLSAFSEKRQSFSGKSQPLAGEGVNFFRHTLTHSRPNALTFGYLEIDGNSWYLLLYIIYIIIYIIYNIDFC